MLQKDPYFVQEFQELAKKLQKNSPYTQYDLYEILNESVD